MEGIEICRLIAFCRRHIAVSGEVLDLPDVVFLEPESDSTGPDLPHVPEPRMTAPKLPHEDREGVVEFRPGPRAHEEPLGLLPCVPQNRPPAFQQVAVKPEHLDAGEFEGPPLSDSAPRHREEPAFQVHVFDIEAGRFPRAKALKHENPEDRLVPLPRVSP